MILRKLTRMISILNVITAKNMTIMITSVIDS